MPSGKPTPGSVAGEISGIMSGILTDAVVALDLGPKTSMNEKMERDYYRDVLERIAKKANRAEDVWAEYFRENK